MNRIKAALIVTALATAIVPASAAWDRIASLDVAAGKTEQFSMENFKGNVIGLTARDTDVNCNRVTAMFSNGEVRPIFKGKLPKGLSVRVDLPPGAVESVEFECHPIKGQHATVDLAADSGVKGEKADKRG